MTKNHPNSLPVNPANAVGIITGKTAPSLAAKEEPQARTKAFRKSFPSMAKTDFKKSLGFSKKRK